MAKDYNLSEGLEEFFTFQVREFKYKFKYLTAEESEKLSTLKGKEATEYIYDFVTPLDESSPPFKDVYKTLLTPEQKNFLHMVKTEFTLE